MIPDDVFDVSRIEQELFTDPWPEFIFDENIADEDCYPFVAQLDKEIIGYTILLIHGAIGHITNLAVTQKYQRKSIAKKLISFILELAAGKLLERLALEVRLSNLPAIKLYESFGFLPWSVKEDYYRNPTEDGLIMVKDLD